MKWRSLQESVPGEDLRPLREQFAERKELIDKYVPEEARAIHSRVAAELKQSGIVDRALSVDRERLSLNFWITMVAWSARRIFFPSLAW